jgi:hypothetical protein
VTDLDISIEDFDRLTKAVGAKLAELTGMPLERAEELAGSSVGCTFLPDDEGMLTFTEPDGTPVVRLPASAFESILWGDEEDEEDPE